MLKYQTFHEYNALARRSLLALRQVRDLAWGGVVHIVGTGPSLLKTDLSRMSDGTALLLNNAITLAKDLPDATTFCVVSDHLRAMELAGAVRTAGIGAFATSGKIFNAKVDPRWFGPPYSFITPAIQWRTLGGRSVPETCYRPGFSDDLEAGIYMGRSVLFPAIQIAYWMGASEIRLVGIDMTNASGAYFDKSIRSNWSSFSYAKDAREHLFRMANALRVRGVSLVNYTVGGELDALPHAATQLRTDIKHESATR